MYIVKCTNNTAPVNKYAINKTSHVTELLWSHT